MKKGFNRGIHNIENSPFRTKFEHEIGRMSGNMGIGCISDAESQPLVVRSRHGSYAITTVGRINNIRELAEETLMQNGTHFLEMSSGDINPTELIAALINKSDSIPEGIRRVQEVVSGSMTMLVLTPGGPLCRARQNGPDPNDHSVRAKTLTARLSNHLPI